MGTVEEDNYMPGWFLAYYLLSTMAHLHTDATNALQDGNAYYVLCKQVPTILFNDI